MQVKPIGHTPEPERTVAMSARLCCSPVGAEELADRRSAEQTGKLVDKLPDKVRKMKKEEISIQELPPISYKGD
jgi:thymidylate synthase (FAD)